MAPPLLDPISFSERAMLGDARLDWTLRPRTIIPNRVIKEMENQNTPGGMRSPHLAQKFFPSLRPVGHQIASALVQELRADPGWATAIEQFRAGSEFPGFTSEKVTPIRGRIFRWLGGNPGLQDDMITPSDMVSTIGHATGDADAVENLADWLSEDGGAPMGILNQIPLAGIFQCRTSTLQSCRLKT